MYKQIYLTIALCFTLININAQNISIDQTGEDGIRQIMTQTKAFSIDQSEFNIGLEAFVQQDSKHWFLNIASYLYLSQDNEVLLKLGNDEVIHLKVNNVHVAQVNSPTYAITNDFVTTIYEPVKINLYSSTYVLTESDMDKIDLHGIAKIRISLSDGFRDKVYINNTLGKYITKSRSIINNLIKEPNSTKDLYQGF